MGFLPAHRLKNIIETPILFNLQYFNLDVNNLTF